MNIRISFIVLLIVCFSMCYGQKYIVFNVYGSPTINSNPIKTNQILTDKSNLNLGVNDRLLIIDENASRTLTLQGPIKGILSRIINSDQTVTKEVSQKYINYLMQKIKSESKSSSYMREAGTVYRETDSLTLKTLKQLQTLEAKDTLSNNE